MRDMQWGLSYTSARDPTCKLAYGNPFAAHDLAQSMHESTSNHINPRNRRLSVRLEMRP